MPDTKQLAAGVREGDLLAGKYRVDKVLGVGGMGVVVAAHHVHLDDRVAIKFMLPDALANRDAVARFAREARAAVRIKSEHVARVTDVGTLENGAPYMVMEYLDGRDLAGWLGKQGALPIEQAIDFVLQACEAVAEAHAAGIVHRDLKPANLFVVRRPDGALSVKVLDFGISKMTGLGGEGAMTKTSALLGSPLYMSPEQITSSKDTDARGDIWALGVILYELIAGVTPFHAESLPELVLKIMSSSPAPLRERLPNAPEGLEAVILKCVEKDRGKRHDTVGQLASALLPFAPKSARLSVERISGVMRSAGIGATALAMPPSSNTQEPTPARRDATAAPWGRTASPATRKTGPAVVMGSLVAAGIAVFALRSRSTDTAAKPSTDQAASAVTVTARAFPALTATTPGVTSASPPLVVPARSADPNGVAAAGSDSALPLESTTSPRPAAAIESAPTRSTTTRKNPGRPAAPTQKTGGVPVAAHDVPVVATAAPGGFDFGGRH